MRTKKYNFIPEHQIGTEGAVSNGFAVTITKGMCIYFNPFDISMYDLDGKFIKVFADMQNKTLSWKEVTGGDISVLENVRQLKVSKLNGNILVGISRILKRMGITKEMLPFKNVPVTRYSESLSEGEFNVIDLRNHIKSKI